MVAFIKSFIKTGNPGWKAFNPSTFNYYSLKQKPNEANGMFKDAYNFWTNTMQKYKFDFVTRQLWADLSVPPGQMVWASFALLVVIFAALQKDSFQCASNGVCGAYGGCAPPPPPPGGCGCAARGYQCGSYGCYRMRARGSKLYQPSRDRARGSKIEADRQILRQKLAEKSRTDSQEELSEVSETAASLRRGGSGEPLNPNRAFFECCMDRQLPDACLQKCNYGAFNKDTLSRMYFKQDACPLAAMSEMQFCAAQGRDHTACCARNGVTTTLAGEKCLLFCDQRPGRVTPLDLSYVPCFDRFESMKSCFWHELTTFYRVR
ncbi:unnamed protein product, partial [Mesorhabditis spiculigera]